MAVITTKFFILSLTAAVTFAVIAEEGPDSPRQYNNHAVPLKSMDINEIFDSEITTEATSLESGSDLTTAVPEKNLNEKSTTEEISSSELEDNGDEHAREKKAAALTTICIKVKSENPYEKNYEYCEPLSKAEPDFYSRNPSRRPNYGYPPQHPQVRPIYPRGPSKNPSARPAPSGYGQPDYVPNRGNQPATDTKSRPVYTAEDKMDPNYYKPKIQPYKIEYDIIPPQVMVVPHVPVAEPYHVPTQGTNRPYNQNGVNYRASPTEQGTSAVDGDYPSGNGARTSYNPYEKHGGKTIYNYHKTKSLDYMPVMTKTIKKTSPLDVLQVLKDIKKKKIKLDYDDDNDEYEPAYGYPSPGDEYNHHEPGYGGGYKHDQGYGAHESEYHHELYYPPHASEGYGAHQHHEDDNTHGLVITCQPSAIGYNGPHPQLELAKHMDLLKHLIHVESDRTYGEVPQVSYPLPQLNQKFQVSNGYGTKPQISQGYGSQSSSAVHIGEGAPSGGYVPPAAYRMPEEGKWPYALPTGADTHEAPYGRNAVQEDANWEGANPMAWDRSAAAADAPAAAEDVGSPTQFQSSANPPAIPNRPTNVHPTLAMPRQPHNTLEQYTNTNFRKSGHMDAQQSKMNRNQNS